MKIKVDPNKCIGAGHCVVSAPRLFAQGEEDGLVILLQPDAGDELVSAALEAARLCPTRAIEVVETGSEGEQTNG